MKRLKIFQFTLIVLFLIFIFFFLRAVNYEKEYTIDEVLINESFNKENKSYYFTLTYQDITIDYLVESKYKHNRKFIKEIDIVEVEDNFCLIPKGDVLTFIPLCYENGEIIYYKKTKESLKSLLPQKYLDEKKELEDTFKDIKIYNRNYTYFLWNYNGFYYINEDKEEVVELFDKEKYNVPLITYTKDYLLIADYNEEYTFNKFIRLSFKDGKKEELELEQPLYFDCYFPGYQKNILYIVDNKEEVMMKLNVKNGKLEKIKPQLLVDGKWIDTSIKTLISQNKTFTNKSNINYELEDSVLMMNYQGKNNKTIIDNDVTSIIRIKDNLIFYLKKDTLYVFNPLEGSTKLLSYFEWNFNRTNMIYVD